MVALRIVEGRRGKPEIVVQRTTVALAPCLEGIAACDLGIASAERIVLAAAAGSRHAVVNEAGRLAHGLTKARNELRRMVGAIEARPKGAA